MRYRINTLISWLLLNYVVFKSSKLVQLKLNIETSGGESTPPEAEARNYPLIEVGV